MQRVTMRLRARLTEMQKARIIELARRNYEGNISMATRHVINLGLQALDHEKHKQERG